MLGDSFALRIDWLAQLIGSAHAPTLGSYKERLLRQVIAEFLPRRYQVGTGFVLFPAAQLSGRGESSAARRPPHEISRQLDLIVYDASEHPVVFREGDFVVVRPEAVRAVIEVKGALDQAGTDGIVDLFLDLARKWKRCRAFYKARHLPNLKEPGLFAMAWATAVDARGRRRTDGLRLRRRIVSRYRSKVDEAELPGLPLLRAVYLYADCVVHSIYWMHGSALRYGYHTSRGRLVRYGDAAGATLAGDATVADLLAGIHVSLDTPFNPMISYVDQTNKLTVLPHEHEGFECWLEDDKSGLVSPKHFQE